MILRCVARVNSLQGDSDKAGFLPSRNDYRRAISPKNFAKSVTATTRVLAAYHTPGSEPTKRVPYRSPFKNAAIATLACVVMLKLAVVPFSFKESVPVYLRQPERDCKGDHGEGGHSPGGTVGGNFLSVSRGTGLTHADAFQRARPAAYDQGTTQDCVNIFHGQGKWEG